MFDWIKKKSSETTERTETTLKTSKLYIKFRSRLELHYTLQSSNSTTFRLSDLSEDFTYKIFGGRLVAVNISMFAKILNFYEDYFNDFPEIPDGSMIQSTFLEMPLCAVNFPCSEIYCENIQPLTIIKIELKPRIFSNFSDGSLPEFKPMRNRNYYLWGLSNVICQYKDDYIRFL